MITSDKVDVSQSTSQK